LTESNNQRPALLRLYQQYLADENCAAFIKGVTGRYTLSTLHRLMSHDSCIARRAAMLAIGFVGSYESNHIVGCALSDGDRGVRLLAENSIRQIWCRCGNDTQRKQLDVVMRLNSSKQHQEARQIASEILAETPDHAEAFNQRAIACFYLGLYIESIHDCHQALEMNPYHFAAAGGMGQCYLQMNDHQTALECFRRALKLNPGLEILRVRVSKMERTLDSH